MKKIIEAKQGHEKEFRETWKLVDEVANDPYWQAAYEYAAKFCLYPDETNSIGPMLERKS